MRAKRTLSLIAAAVAIAALAAVGATLGTGTDKKSPPKTGFIQGTVTSGDDRPEAGVWVIAETADLPTPYRKIVVTDQRGRFVLPELPEADYDVWARGYGINDSAKVQATVERRGKPRVAIEAEVATTPQERAANYPANYWLSLFKPPADTESLPGGRNQHLWMSQFKLSCQLCHQMGSASARGMRGDRARLDAGLKKARSMDGSANGFGRDALLDALADWGGRIAAGQVPDAPPRPQGIERNFVITQWAWGDLYTYAHDEIATDRRNPRLYPDGKIWGVDLGNDRLLSVDPVTHEADAVKVPTLPGHTTPWCDQVPNAFATLGCPTPDGSTPHLGAYQNPANPHNPMLDDTGKVWLTTQIRPETADDLPEFCKRDPFMVGRTPHRQLAYYDTNTGEFELIDTCFATHHLQFDEHGVLWMSNDGQVIGWFDPAKYTPGRPETAGDAQGWSRRMVDTDGDGQADTPATGSYGVIPNDADGSVWSASPGGGVQGNTGRGNIQRYDPATDTHEAYHPPNPGMGPRGIDADSKGIIWTGLGGSGHLAKFDRSKCARTWGNGDQCPEGWTLYRSPGPTIDTGEGPENETNADFHYYLWVDQFNTLGMGKDTVILNGTGSDSLLAFDQKTEKFTVIRVPYPLNLFTRGLDGRIDDPKAGWKGRGLWFDNGTDPVLHSEVQQSYVGHVQLRPNPLAR
jgi:hypothetical protein